MTSPVQEIITSIQLANAAAALFTSPAGTWTQIIKLTFTNTDTVTRVVTVHIVPAGAGAGAANKSTILKAILPNDTWNSPNEYGIVLNPGDAIYGFADAASVVNCFGAGILATG